LIVFQLARNNAERRAKCQRSSEFHLTDHVLRKAEKQVPRTPGRKPTSPEQ
jgi:hypothetical protein